jgi:hypothetical protein
MCEPLTVATATGTTLTATGSAAVTAGISALTAIPQFIGQMSAASAQADYQQQMADNQNAYMVANAEAANKAYIDQAQQENAALAQERERVSEEKQAAQIDALERAGTAMSSNDNAQSAVRNILRGEARYNSQLDTNLGWKETQTGQRIEGLRAEASNRISSVRPYVGGPINRPSIFSTAAGIAGAAGQRYIDRLPRG